MAASKQPVVHRDPERCVEDILSRVGKRLVLGLPLGIGKANNIANALYERAAGDPSIDLEILTALTLGPPHGGTDLERRFLQPLFARIAPDYPALAYGEAQRKGRLPANVAVHEFFLPAGRRLGSAAVQQAYICANYTHIARDLLDRGVNVVAQLVARRGDGPDAMLSLSSNTDVALDLLPALLERRAAGVAVAIAGEVNPRMPFMPGPAVVAPDHFDLLLDGPGSTFEPFALPKQPVSLTRYASALRVATLIEDGGTLQIGIGAFADALTESLKLRHQHNRDFRDLVGRLPAADGPGPAPALAPFEDGLYASSEMLVEGLLDLKDAGIIKRRVDMRGRVPEGEPDQPSIHAAFFLGARFFYDRLRSMPESELADIAMTAVSFVNQLYGDEELKRAQRVKARFVNNALMATLLGAVVSDGLEDGRVVSGVGGQYNFVAMAHALEGARSIIALDAVRHHSGRPVSNILWNYGNVTIPRHLRDIVVTEYGVADLRGRSDRDVIAAMLNIADSRFQADLLARAKAAGKIERGYRIPDDHRDNRPARIAAALGPARDTGLLPHFPLGSDMTPAEERLALALSELKDLSGSRPRLAAAVVRTALGARPSAGERECLVRLGLDAPEGPRERLLAWSVLWALRAARRP